MHNHSSKKSSVAIITLTLTLALIASLILLNTLYAQRADPPLSDATGGNMGRADIVSSAEYSATHQLFLPLIKSPYKLFLPLIYFGNAAPEVFGPFPAPDADRQSLNAYLLWSHSGDPEGDDYYFEVYLEAGDETPDELIGETTSRFLAPSFAFELDTEYYWQVVSVDARGAINAGPVWTFNTEDMPYPPPVGDMISIPAGEFSMGCDPNNPSQACRLDELPLHVVYLDGYAIDKYEVTNQQYRRCVDEDACNLPRRFDSLTRDSYFYDSDYDYYPVLFVSRWDAGDYCTWADKRLPTEAEFEKAARGVVDTRAWPWGDAFPTCSQLNFTDTSIEPWNSCVGDTAEVGSYPAGASPYGVMDVSGNVFEWVSDIYRSDYYANSPYENPPGPTEPEGILYFVIRGGTYRPQWFYPQVSHRHYGHHGDTPFHDAPYYRNNQVGFRCAQDVEEGN